MSAFTPSHEGRTRKNDGRFVVSIRMTGLGDRLASLGAAWRYARNSGRTLVADWRFGGITSDPANNAFLLCFEASAQLAGVHFRADLGHEIVHLPFPRYPEIWNEDVFLALPFLRPPDGEATSQQHAVQMIREGRDVSARTVVFDGCINDGLVNLEDARTFFSALRPVPHIAHEISQFQRDHLLASPTIGVHIRHGNGGNIMGHKPYWASFEAAIQRCVRAAHRARHLLGKEATILLCTDSIEAQEAFVSRVANVVTRRKNFRPLGTGELHLGESAWAGRDDALVEMLLLAKCDAIVRYPPGSFFSYYGAVMMAPPDANLATVYDLQKPWDSADPLSPALIVSATTSC